MRLLTVFILLISLSGLCPPSLCAQDAAVSPGPPEARSVPESTVQPTATLPSDTDRGISNFNAPHLSWLPTSSPRNQLLLFLPGTSGKPKPGNAFAATAANLGYHVIVLSYPDNISANHPCAKSHDPNAHIKFRLAVIEGGNFASVQIDRVDSIENRLAKLLRYLAAKQPSQGWAQFLDANQQQINWRKIAVSGHSQGGGHAIVIAKYHEVARVITFGSPKDFSHHFHRPANGFDTNSKTPLNRYFTFNHLEDSIAGCSHDLQMRILQQMGPTRLGIANADRDAPSYNHAHILVTDIQLSDMKNMGAIHGAPVSYASALSPTLRSLCLPAWKYMLTEAVR